MRMHRTDSQTDIQRAIRRAGRARAAQQRRRRRSAALLTLLAASLAGGSLWGIGAVTGNDMVEAAVTKAQSLSDLIAKRSPGARTEGQLTKTNHAKALAKLRSAPALRQPAAAEMRKPSAKTDMAQVADLLSGPPLVPAGVHLQQPFPIAELTPPPSSLGAIVFPGSGPGSPGGGSPPATIPGTEPKPPIIPPPAVPEPGTWATMLFGFGLIGWHLRRRPVLLLEPKIA